MRDITAEAILDNISMVTAFVDEELMRVGCPRKAKAQIDICIDEIFANIARYAYDSDTGDVTIHIEFDEVERLFSLSFIDCGKPFDPRDVPEPDITSPLEERPIGGLGLFMVKNLTDSIAYRREDGRNVLTIQKRI